MDTWLNRLSSTWIPAENRKEPGSVRSFRKNGRFSAIKISHITTIFPIIYYTTILREAIAMESSKNLAENLKRYRKEKNKTCYKFAEELGIGKTTLYKLEKGTDGFSSETLDHIAAILELPPSVLLADPVSPQEFPESVILTSGAFATLAGERQEEAIYHFDQLISLLQPDIQRWLNCTEKE